MTGDPWTPANDVERELRDAADAGDTSRLLAILAVAPLVLPGFTEDETPHRGQQRLLTRDRDGVPYLLVFTSVETMRRTLHTDVWRATSLPELVRAWPDLDTPVPWGLAINAATPIVVLVPPEAVPTLLPTPATLAPFVPHNQVEQLLRDALAAPDPHVLLDVLVTAPVTVPHQSLVIDGEPVVAVFTSPERCVEYLREAGLDVPTVTVDLVAVLRRWPDTAHRLMVNPGSLIEISLPGDRMPYLLAHAVKLARDAVPAPTPEHGAEPVPEPPPPGDITDLLRGQVRDR